MLKMCKRSGRFRMGRRLNTITNTTLASPTYNGNGATTAFATGFQFAANADLQVIVTSSTGVETIKTLTTHYTVTGAGNSAGGTVTFLSAPVVGEKVNIRSNVTLDQQTDYIEGGSFAASTHEAALDKLTKISQQIKEQANRSITLPISNQSVETQTNTITAGYVLRVNTDGDGIEWVSSTDAALAGDLTPTDGGFVVGDGTEFVVETGSTARTSLGLGTIATQAADAVAISGGTVSGITDLAIADGGTGASTAANARTNLGLAIGTDVQAYSAELTSLAGLNFSTKWTSASAAGPASLQFHEDTDNGTNKITLQAPSTLAGDFSMVLPTALPGGTEYLTIDNTGAIATATGTGATTPGGSNTHVQYNNAGNFGGAAGFTFDGTGTVYVANGIELGAATDTTLTRSSAGNVAIEGNVIYRAGGTDVIVADGGTGLSSTTAYAVLCGGTTSTGALQSIASVGTSGQVLTSNGAGALPTFQTNSSGALVKISSTVASSSATVSFTGLSSSYRDFLVVLSNVVPATDNVDFYMRTSTNNGSSYDSGAANYRYAYYGTITSATTDTAIRLNGNTGNGTAEGVAGWVRIHNPQSAAGKCQVTYHTSTYVYTDSLYSITGAAYRDTAADVDAIQFYFSSGNIASGTITLYGITT